MKFRLFALILALSLVGWAQETPAASAAPNSTPATQAKGCCHHNTAGAKEGKSCCHHSTADAKEADACCGKAKCEAKDAKSCCEGKDMKAEMKECKKNGCCKDGKSCGASKDDKASAGCCGNKCEHHQHAAEVS